jgi:hypothetical protein
MPVPRLRAMLSPGDCQDSTPLGGEPGTEAPAWGREARRATPPVAGPARGDRHGDPIRQALDQRVAPALEVSAVVLSVRLGGAAAGLARCLAFGAQGGGAHPGLNLSGLEAGWSTAPAPGGATPSQRQAGTQPQTRASRRGAVGGPGLHRASGARRRSSGRGRQAGRAANRPGCRPIWTRTPMAAAAHSREMCTSLNIWDPGTARKASVHGGSRLSQRRQSGPLSRRRHMLAENLASLSIRALCVDGKANAGAVLVEASL